VNGKKDLVAFMHKLNKELRRNAELQFSIQLELDTLQQLKVNHSGSSSGNNPISRSDARNAGFNRGSNTQNPQSKKQNKNKDKKSTYSECSKCGRFHPMPCDLAEHPNVNKENVKWSLSKVGQLWKERGHYFLPKKFSETLDTCKLIEKSIQGNNNHSGVRKMCLLLNKEVRFVNSLTYTIY
jgi:hypothetical protein